MSTATSAPSPEPGTPKSSTASQPKTSEFLPESALPALLRTPPGRYRHYKGNFYEVIDTVRHSETLEPLTLYRALYGENGLWVRPAAMFLEEIEHNGVRQPRFSRVE